MVRKRRAVGTGSTGQRPRRGRPSIPADAASPEGTVESSLAMSSTNTRPKRNPRRAAKDPWEEEKLMTSTSSPLVGLDLVKLLARPEAWDRLEESEKQEILSLLPEGTHPNPYPPPGDPDAKIPPLPESFLRYSNHWRDGVRNFQLDLQSGRYDPDWLHQAEEAMTQRAAGNFDKFKEDEYEEFWGQKQKLDKTIIAGQSSRVKLQTLVEQGLVREGDVWKYSRAFSKGPGRILVEKEAKIVAINGPRLTFAIPPGQRVFLSNVNGRSNDSETKVQTENNTSDRSEIEGSHITPSSEETPSHTNEKIETEFAGKRKSDTAQPTVQKRRRGRGKTTKIEEPPACDPVPSSSNDQGEARQLAVEARGCPSAAKATSETGEAHANSPRVQSDDQTVVGASLPANDSANETRPSMSTEQIENLIIPNITWPNALASKIVEVDGRVEKAPHGNAWKDCRCYRNNQDMGSLWEVRQAWFLKNT
ncbi:hypothetical protein EYZ11_002328 [Aspergillus tanneri]|uniref:DEUBAD domain-containing protein n=1 Tax=Aspergillus tanneri TaxID=1220188 RepID=A0A4S3JR40_9EURO|nr:uncharacterized protein ATNIH1004_010058 [Aspergillus tanneri]KAA8643291.1 hypothetical protein ATNIH1004_010058 [Aspergillus tanneri]THC98172.1 hypothetical protein EYZ11_002328 [Aspergillus tanneri]